jgi:hypothetical protein
LVGEHTFWGDHGSPHARFQRALRAGSVIAAKAAARDLATVNLADALALVAPYGGDPVLVRWLPHSGVEQA